MDKQEWNRIGDSAFLVNIMHIEGGEPVYRDVAGVLRDRVHLLLCFSPVVAILPARDKSLDVRERCTVLVSSILQLVGEPCELEFLVEKLDFSVGDVYLERLL